MQRGVRFVGGGVVHSYSGSTEGLIQAWESVAGCVPIMAVSSSGQRNRATPSGGHQADGQFLVATDHQAVDPPRSASRVEGDVTRSRQQNAQHIPRLNPSKGRSNAMMDASTERHVSPWSLPGQIDGLGVIKHGGVTVGRTPEQEDRCPGRNFYPAECCVIGNVAHVIAEWWLQPQSLLHEHGDQLRTLT